MDAVSLLGSEPVVATGKGAEGAPLFTAQGKAAPTGQRNPGGLAVQAVELCKSDRKIEIPKAHFTDGAQKVVKACFIFFFDTRAGGGEVKDEMDIDLR